MRPAALLLLLVASQATLGALVVMSGLQPIINTLHVVNGALVLGTSLLLTLRSYKGLMGTFPVQVPGSGFGVHGSRLGVQGSSSGFRLQGSGPIARRHAGPDGRRA